MSKLQHLSLLVVTDSLLNVCYIVLDCGGGFGKALIVGCYCYAVATVQCR